MNLDHLRVFTTVAETSSLSEAAQRLFLTQPAVTQQMRRLESQFDVQLIERTNRGVTLTEAGKILSSYANRIVALYDELEKNMDDLRASVRGAIAIGATSTIGGYAVPCSICIFKEKYPEAKVKLKVGNRRQITSDLREGQIDLALIEGGDLSGPFVKSVLATDELVVVVPNREPWLKRTSITLAELQRLPIIMREFGSGTRKIIEDALLAAHLDPEKLNIVMELDNVNAIKAAVETGVGVSIMSPLALRKELFTKTLLALQPEGVSFQQKIFLAYMPERVQTKLAKAFISFIHSPNRGFC